MKRINVRIIVGALLIGAGILFLLQTFNILPNAWGIIWTIVLLVGSGIFFYSYYSDQRQWWALIPGMALLGLAGTIFVDAYIPFISYLSSAFFLAGVGLGFWAIYLTNREFWWAIIPGGVLITLGFVTIVEDLVASEAEGGIFFIGLALTFLLIALFAKPKENFWWAYIPTGVLLFIGAFQLGPLQTIFNYIWPIALIIFGGILLLRNFRKS
jgi:hypothetical protein